MTVFAFLKASFTFVMLMGVILTGAGIWKIGAAYIFSKNSVVHQGIFMGYHIHRTQSSTLDSGSRYQQKSVEYLPVFSYVNSGIRHEITGRDGHFFRHLKNKINKNVTVLASPDDPREARLGDLLSLYLNGILLCLGSLVFVMLPRYGIKYISIWQEAALSSAAGSGGIIRKIGQQQIPLNDIVIYLGGFIIIAGAVMAFGYYYFSKRSSNVLVRAIERGEYKNAYTLASQGTGIDGKTEKNETALIAALKANQPDIACAIINNLFVSLSCSDADGNLAMQMAASNSDRKTLALMLKKGELIHNIRPKEIYYLIYKNDADTIKFLIDNGFDIKNDSPGFTYGDRAVLEGKADVVRLIQKSGGAFNAPPVFTALAADDPEALEKALKNPEAVNQKFRGLTLERFAEKIGKSEQIQ